MLEKADVADNPRGTMEGFGETLLETLYVKKLKKADPKIDEDLLFPHSWGGLNAFAVGVYAA